MKGAQPRVQSRTCQGGVGLVFAGVTTRCYCAVLFRWPAKFVAGCVLLDLCAFEFATLAPAETPPTVMSPPAPTDAATAAVLARPLPFLLSQYGALVYCCMAPYFLTGESISRGNRSVHHETPGQLTNFLVLLFESAQQKLAMVMQRLGHFKLMVITLVLFELSNPSLRLRKLLQTDEVPLHQVPREAPRLLILELLGRANAQLPAAKVEHIVFILLFVNVTLPPRIAVIYVLPELVEDVPLVLPLGHFGPELVERRLLIMGAHRRPCLFHCVFEVCAQLHQSRLLLVFGRVRCLGPAGINRLLGLRGCTPASFFQCGSWDYTLFHILLCESGRVLLAFKFVRGKSRFSWQLVSALNLIGL